MDGWNVPMATRNRYAPSADRRTSVRQRRDLSSDKLMPSSSGHVLPRVERDHDLWHCGHFDCPTGDRRGWTTGVPGLLVTVYRCPNDCSYRRGVDERDRLAHDSRTGDHRGRFSYHNDGGDRGACDCGSDTPCRGRCRGDHSSNGRAVGAEDAQHSEETGSVHPREA